ncbi:MAG: hypothetical protein LBU84_06415 [Prevotella sp.]|nr:hypothetical protein [Prevotella sp.]
MLVLGAVLGWLPNRNKNKADTRKVETEVLTTSLQTLRNDVVEPLRVELKTLREDYDSINKTLKTLQNAINKMYGCPALPSCPIRVELQKQDRNGKNRKPKQPTNRQREPVDKDNDESSDSSTIDSETEYYT